MIFSADYLALSNGSCLCINKQTHTHIYIYSQDEYANGLSSAGGVLGCDWFVCWVVESLHHHRLLGAELLMQPPQSVALITQNKTNGHSS